MVHHQRRIGIVGSGHAARLHLARFLAIDGVIVVGCADPDLAAAESLASWVSSQSPTQTRAFADHRDLIKQLAPDALAIFTPHLAHYRPAVDALQAGCHLFIEKPLSTNVQEAVDIVGLARVRDRKVAVGHQYRLRPSLAKVKASILEGTVGPIHLVTATLSQPWLSSHAGAENSWRFEPKIAGGGILADSGDHLVDALLWTTGQTAVEVAALESKETAGLDLVTAAAIKLSLGTLATLGISGVSSAAAFELSYYGEKGRIRVTDLSLEIQAGDAPAERLDFPESPTNIDRDFISAIVDDTHLCCPADQALDTVRLLEAIARSATTGQVVPLA